MHRIKFILSALLAMLAMPSLGLAADHFHLPGAELSILWVIPFVCMLLSIALGPLKCPHFWEHNFGKISLFWALMFLIPCGFVFGFGNAFFLAADAILLDNTELTFDGSVDAIIELARKTGKI